MDEALTRQARRAREAICAGALRGQPLLERLLEVPFTERDAWVDAALGVEAPPPDEGLPQGAVPYLPCPVDDVVTLLREAPVGARDTFVDLGSGLGRVVMLANLLTGARGVGLEVQRHLVERSVERAGALGLRDVAFHCADATATDLEGSVFFLYAPFNGALLDLALGRLAAVARRHRITIGSVGVELVGQPWLGARQTSSVSLMLYESR